MKVKNGKEGILFINFNQDSSRISVGTTSAFRTYSCDGQNFRLMYEKHSEGTSILEMLFNSSLVAQVGSGDGGASSTQRSLRMLNTRRDKEITRLNYNSPVLSVKLNRRRLVVVLETEVFIYDITNMKQEHNIQKTPPNPKGICALASCDGADDGNFFFAYPGSADSGEVHIFDTVHLRNITTINAHQSAVSCLALSNNGDKLCTASEKGTVIRVFGANKGEKLFEFRRSFRSYAGIYSLSFNMTATALSVSSDHATIHVFKLEDTPPAEAEGWGSYLGAAVSSYLPTTVTDALASSKSFAQCTLPAAGVENVAVLHGSEEDLHAYVVTADGYFYKYKIDWDQPDNVVLVATHSILQAAEPDQAGSAAAAAAAATAGSSERDSTKSSTRSDKSKEDEK